MQKEQVIIPLDFRRHFISFVKTLLLNSPFFQRFEKEKPGYSPYVFGVEFAKIDEINSNNQQLIIQPPVTVSFSTGLFNLLSDICNSLIANKSQLSVLGLKLNSVNVLPLKKIRSSTVEFQIVGHAALRGERDYVEPNDRARLEEAINTHMLTKANFIKQFYSEPTEMHISPVALVDSSKLHKGVCQHYGGKITTLRGSIMLFGSPECLQFLYDYGLGVRTGQGFGLLEVIKQ